MKKLTKTAKKNAEIGVRKLLRASNGDPRGALVLLEQGAERFYIEIDEDPMLAESRRILREMIAAEDA